MLQEKKIVSSIVILQKVKLPTQIQIHNLIITFINAINKMNRILIVGALREIKCKSVY